MDKSGSLGLLADELVKFLDKPRSDFTKEDIIKFVSANDIRMLNFRYVGGDGRLKTLNFVVQSRKQLDRILTLGERVDGSNLFEFIDVAMSDLYVVPRYRTAFVNPFSEIPTLDILCSYYTDKGEPFESAPEQVVRRAHQVLKETTGMTLEAHGELEFYIIAQKSELYPMEVQRGYHESMPFSKFEKLRQEAMLAIARAGGHVKYAHSEVGALRYGDLELEQNEIEFLPEPLEDAADHLVIARWILRVLGYKYGVNITFAPKILMGYAGSGLHIHIRTIKDGENTLINEDMLSEIARHIIGGLLELATSLTAFGNTIPISYLRLVPHQEAPTAICWGYSNRSALVRVPLAWRGVKPMFKDANPNEQSEIPQDIHPQTIEFRVPDGSANVHFLLAGIAVAVRHGLQSSTSLKTAADLFIEGNVFNRAETMKKLPHLPSSCWESAEWLEKHRSIYEEHSVFPKKLIDWIIKSLKAHRDKGLSEKLFRKDKEIEKLVSKFIHYP